MKITAALCWYAETPETLSRCAKSLAGYCDTLVAFGGRWEGFPEVIGDDEDAQALALVEGCDEVGLFYEVGFGEWETQVEKRAALMEHAANDSDWVLVIDADEHIARGDSTLFHKGLSETDCDVARVFTQRVPTPYGRNIQRVYRSSTGVSVTTAHNGYVTSDGRFLNGDPCYVDLAPTAELGEFLVIEHDLTCRDQTRKHARSDYLRFRRQRRIESWV